MGDNKPLQVWRSVAEQAPEVNEQLTDGLDSLRALRNRYNEKIIWLTALGKSVDYYVQAVVALDTLTDGEALSAATL